jgi:phosphatidylglycerophosphate synthase
VSKGIRTIDLDACPKPFATPMKLRKSDVIKSPDVEDPVNFYIHRSLQLLLTRPLVRTPITPNQITFLSLCAGLVAAYLIAFGTSTERYVAAGLMFASAILDGVDGMIARVKKSSSETGHAIDGAADYFVNVSTTAAAVYHLGQTSGHPWIAVALGLAAHSAWAQHLMLYDFHCALYLRFLTGGKHQGGDRARAQATLAKVRESGSLFKRVLMTVFVWQLGNRQGLLEKLSPRGAKIAAEPADEAFAREYVETHRAPMRLWAYCGNALHMDLFALAIVFDRFDVYFLMRIFGFSLVAVVATIWERRVLGRHAMFREAAS